MSHRNPITNRRQSFLKKKIEWEQIKKHTSSALNVITYKDRQIAQIDKFLQRVNPGLDCRPSLRHRSKRRDK